MKKLRGNEALTSLALVLIGALFMIFKGEVISIAMSLIGFTLIALGIYDIVRKFTMSGVVKIAFALLVMVAGWLLINLALYILGAFLFVAGAWQLYALWNMRFKRINLAIAMHIAQPVIYILVAICLFFNQGGAISWVFTVSGLFLLIDGLLGIIGVISDRK